MNKHRYGLERVPRVCGSILPPRSSSRYSHFREGKGRGQEREVLHFTRLALIFEGFLTWNHSCVSFLIVLFIFYDSGWLAETHLKTDKAGDDSFQELKAWCIICSAATFFREESRPSGRGSPAIRAGAAAQPPRVQPAVCCH